MKALIHENIVVDIVENQFDVHPSSIWMDAPEGCKTGWILRNNTLVAPEASPPASYTELRKAAYPLISEQLDMLYHDIKNGTLDSGAWIQAIEAVKTQYPKP